MAKNLNQELHTIAGVGRLWILNYRNGWDGASKIETMIIPFTKSGIIGTDVQFDLIGKLDMDSVEDNGEDMNIVNHRNNSLKFPCI